MMPPTLLSNDLQHVAFRRYCVAGIERHNHSERNRPGLPNSNSCIIRESMPDSWGSTAAGMVHILYGGHGPYTGAGLHLRR